MTAGVSRGGAVARWRAERWIDALFAIIPDLVVNNSACFAGMSVS